MSVKNTWWGVLFLFCLASGPVASVYAQSSETQAEQTEDTNAESAENAEEASPDPIQVLREEYTNLSVIMRGVADRHNELTRQITNASVSEALVIENQVTELKVEFVKNMRRQVAIYHELSRLDDPAREIRKEIEDLLARTSKGLHENLDANQRRLAKMRSDRDAAAREDKAVVDQRIFEQEKWLIQLYDFTYDQTESLKSMGMDYKRLEDYLIERVSNDADFYSSRLEVVDQGLSQLNEIAKSATLSQEQQDEVKSLGIKKTQSVNTLREMVRLMGALKLDTTKYQRVLVTTSGKVTTDLLDADVAATLLTDWISFAYEWLSRNALDVALDVVVFFLIVFVFRLLSLVAGKLIERGMSKGDVSPLLKIMLKSVVRGAIVVFGVLVAFSQLGIHITPLLAGLGIFGFIIGFALQDSLSNFASGLMILSYRPFDIGDTIEVCGVMGVVKHMTLISATIRTFDNQVLTIPNNKIWGSVIRNMTAQTKRRIDMEFIIDPNEDIDHVLACIEDEVNKNEQVLDDPAPAVKLNKVTIYGMEVIARPWALREEYFPTHWALQRAIKKRLAEEKIVLAFQQSPLFNRTQEPSG